MNRRHADRLSELERQAATVCDELPEIVLPADFGELPRKPDGSVDAAAMTKEQLLTLMELRRAALAPSPAADTTGAPDKTPH